MIWLLPVLSALIPVSALAFVCGFALDETDEQAAAAKAAAGSIDFTQDDISLLLLFGTYQGDTAGPYSLVGSNIPGSAGDSDDVPMYSPSDFFDIGMPGSFSHYMSKMSRGKLTITGPPDARMTTWHQSTTGDEFDDYNPNDCERLTPLTTFAKEILAVAYNEDGGENRIPFEDYDALGVVIPDDFEHCVNGTVIRSYSFDVPGEAWEYRKVLIITLDTFDNMVGFMAHEYGHFMGLPELFDRSHQDDQLRGRVTERARLLHEDDIDDLSEARLHAQEEHDLYLHSAGLGFWGLMAGGARGWQVVDQDGSTGTKTAFFHFPAPHPMTAWSRLDVGWLDEKVIQGNSTVTVKDISEESEAYKIPISGTDQYFLFENRQNTYDADGDNSVGSPYAEHDPQSGLFIWHVDENTGIGDDANEWEERKRVDLECADGLSLGHSTTGAADSETGLDGMDRRHHVPDEQYHRQEFGGNNGDTGDLWDGTADKREFTPDSNPSSNGYETWTKPTERFREIFSGDDGFDTELGSGDTLLVGHGTPQNFSQISSCLRKSSNPFACKRLVQTQEVWHRCCPLKHGGDA